MLDEARCGGLAVPEFADAVVTEVAGPGLRIRSSLHARQGDRLLVLFGAADGSEKPPCVAEHIGYVRHCQSVGDELSLAVELTGLNSVEMDELIRLASLAESPYDEGEAERTDQDGRTDERSDAGTAVESHVGQGV